MDLSSFAEALSRGQRPVWIPGPCDKFAKLFNEEAFWETVTKGKSDGAVVPKVSHTPYQLPLAFKKEPIVRALRSGATVCVSHIDKATESLRQLCLDAESALGFPGSACVHCYMSPPATGYDFFHMDSGAAVTLQIAGTKTWQFSEEAAVPWSTRVGGYREERLEWFGATDWEPVRGSFPSPDGQRIVERVLTPGDVLVMPAGVWHRVHSIDSTSMSLNLKLTHTSSVEGLLQMIRHLCLDDEFWRRPLPFASEEELRSGLMCETTRSELYEQLIRLSNTIREIASDDALVGRLWFRNFLGSQDDVVGADHEKLRDTDVLQIPPRVVPRLCVNSDGSATLLGQGKIMHVRGRLVAPLLRELLERQCFSVDDVHTWTGARGLDSDDIRQILKRLIRAGFLLVVASKETTAKN
jgi:hypothetical protein